MIEQTLVASQVDFESAIMRLKHLWGAPSGTPQGNELDLLINLVAEYEHEHESVGEPEPVEAIRIRMTDLCLTETDIAQALGIGQDIVAAILSRGRHVGFRMVAPLAALLGLSAECLLQPYLYSPQPARRARKPAGTDIRHTRKLARSLRSATKAPGHQRTA